MSPSTWPALAYDDWAPCADTVHALTQLLGKLAVALAPPEPQLQHGALRLSARGWETLALPAPDGSGAFVAVLDLVGHRLRIEHSAGAARDIAVVGRSVGEVTRETLTLIGELAGAVTINPTAQEVSWSDPLDEDETHRHYDPALVAPYFAAATQAALVLADYRAPFRGRSTPVNAWWGSFDLAVSLFSGQLASPPSDDFIMRNAMDAQEVAVGWWPGDARSPQAAFYAYAHPAPDGFSAGTLSPDAARWDAELGEFVLEWSAVRAAEDPHATAVAFARSAFMHACEVCDWPAALADTIQSSPPPVH